MKNRGTKITAADVLKIDEENRKRKSAIEDLQAKRNLLAKEIANAKKQKQDANVLLKEAQQVNSELKKLEENNSTEEELQQLLLTIPNIPDDSVPVGADENSNIEVEKFGEIRQLDFEPKSHVELGEALGLLDFKQSALMSGARFSTLFGDLALLERALSNFMLDIASEFGYTEASPPNMVKTKAMYAAGQLPKFAEEAFSTPDGYWMIPTAEVSLVNLVAEKILAESELPLRFTAYTPCFRREAGAAGKDTTGMIRQHQFKKVELVSITTEEQSAAEHERMTNVAKEVLKRLELPFRTLLLCTGDMGFSSQKTYDLEVWLPSQKKYREISSCSNFGNFQGRRLNVRYKSKDKNHIAHTLNGSSLAVGRTIVAILENYQNRDGSISVPVQLIEYMKGKKLLTKS